MGFLPVSRHSIVKTASRKRDRQRTFQNEESRAGRAWPSVPRRGAPRVKVARRGPGRPPAAGRDVDVKREHNVTLIRNRDRACAPCACANTCTRSDTIPPVSRSRSGSSGRSHALACTGRCPEAVARSRAFTRRSALLRTFDLSLFAKVAYYLRIIKKHIFNEMEMDMVLVSAITFSGSWPTCD